MKPINAISSSRHGILRMRASAMLMMLGAAVRASSATEPDPRAARFDDVVSHYERCGYLRGAVLVAQHGQVIYARGVGEANQLLHTPNTAHTRFGIASITKQFTAALVLQQVDSGRISLDGKISDYLPWYRKDTGRRMTVEQLLHHTSGLPADYDQPEFGDGSAACRHYEPEEFAKKFCQPDLVAEPGAKWAYSNCGYILLGLILEQATGESFEDLLDRQLLAPLGMKNSGLNHDGLAAPGGAAGYTRHAGPRYAPGPALDYSHIFSGGAMYASVEDLLRWNQALSSTNFFPENIRRAIFTPGQRDWAYGWFVTRISPGSPGAGSVLAEMRGDMPGNFFAWMLRYPEQDAVIIVLRNGYGSTEHLEENLQAVLFNQAPRLPSRSPKDVLAHCGLLIWNSVSPYLLLLTIFTLLGLALVVWVKRLRPKSAPNLLASFPGAK